MKNRTKNVSGLDPNPLDPEHWRIKFQHIYICLGVSEVPYLLLEQLYVALRLDQQLVPGQNIKLNAIPQERDIQSDTEAHTERQRVTYKDKEKERKTEKEATR